MKLFPESKYLSVNIKSKSQQYFIALWLELLYPKTLDTYSAKVMNLKSLTKELIRVIIQFLEKQISKENVKAVSSELIWSMKNDPVVKKIYPQTNHLIEIFQIDNKKINYNELQKLKTWLQSFLRKLDNKYINLAISELDESIKNGKDFSEIKSLTNIIVTDLLSSGFSSTYLYKQCLASFFGRKSGNTFTSKWNHFKKTVIMVNEKRSIVVIPSKDYESIYMNENLPLNIKIRKRPTYYSAQSLPSNYNLTKYSFFIEIILTAKDPFSAYSKASENLKNSLDIVNFEFSNIWYPSKKFMVYDFESNKYISPGAGAISALESRTGNMKHYRYLAKNCEVIYTNFPDSTTARRIKNSLRYYHMAVTSNEVQTKYVNLWVSLEYLVQTAKGESLIKPIITFVPKVLALKYLHKIILDLWRNIKSNLTGTASKSLKELCNANGVKNIIKATINYLLNDNKRDYLITEFDDIILLKNRITEVSDLIRNNEKIWQALDKHHRDIEWHLRRLYRIRNDIMHGGEAPKNLDRLVKNLNYYVFTILGDMIFRLGQKEALSSNELLYKYESHYSMLMNKLTKEKSKLYAKQLHFEPAIVEW